MNKHNPGAQSGAKPKTLAYGGGECIEPKVGNFHIYKVSDTQEDVDKSGHQISLRTNHFPLKTNIPGRIICYYNLYIISIEKEEVKEFNRKLLLVDFNLFKRYSKIFLNPHATVFDGLKMFTHANS